MIPADIMLLLFTGILAGFLSGFLGIGGGIIMVPALAFLLQYDMHVAVGTTLLAMIFLTLTGGISHFRNKEFDRKAWLGLIGGGIPGAYVGSYLAAISPSAHLSLVFGGIVIIMGVLMITEGVKTPEIEEGYLRADNYVIFLIAAFGIGMMSALIGLGGGIFMVPLMMFLGLQHSVAVGTSLGVIVLTSLSGSIGYINHGDVEFIASLILIISALSFAHIGARTTSSVSREKFRRIFGLVAIAVGFRTFIAGLSSLGI